MLHQPVMWEIMQRQMRHGQWFTINQIYGLVEENAELDAEDFLPQSPTSDIPKWKRNVRNVLQYRKGTGELEWDGDARYRIP